MKQTILLIIAFLLTFQSVLLAQRDNSSMWNDLNIEEAQLSEKEQKTVNQINADYFNIESSVFQELVDKLQGEYKNEIVLDLPLEKDNFANVKLQSYNVMHPDLAERYPFIKTYRTSVDGKNIYLTISQFGLHAYIKSEDGLTFIEPLSTETSTRYHRYSIEDYESLENLVNCGVGDEMMPAVEKMKEIALNRSSDDFHLRKYRVAILATQAFAEEFGSDFDQTFAEVTDLVNGLNAIFINEVAIQFEMIPESDQLIFTDIENDPFGDDNQDGNYLLNNATVEIYNIIGKEAFDVGHILSYNCSGGFAGVSRFQIVCNNSKKAAGVSCLGLSSNFLLTNAHEFGHHFGASHTWNNCPPSLGQRSQNTAVEPGSGSTIMSYSGLCGSQNLGVPRGNYFHNVSIEQILNFSRIQNGNSCAQLVPVENHPPTVEIIDRTGATIPVSTLFELRGSGSDPDGDDISYSWEQVNTGPVSPLGQPMGSAPAFRSQEPQNEPYRIFPKLTNALSHISDKTEVLPTYERDLNFRITARDDNEVAGGTDWQEIELHVTENAGPFRITKPDKDQIVKAGDKVAIEWNVANTDQAPVNCERVDILLSTTGGFGFNYMISENTENDGYEEVLLPAQFTSSARIKVKAANNVFFDFSEGNFDIVEPDQPTYALTYGPYFKGVCTPVEHSVDINTESLLGYEEDITLRLLSDLPSDMTATFGDSIITAGESTTLNFDLTEFGEVSTYEFEVQALSDSDTVNFKVGFETLASFYDNFALESPMDGIDNVAQAASFSWIGDADADSYDLQVSTSPNFSNPVVDRELALTEYQVAELLEKRTVYFWRVRPANPCGNGAWSETRVFKTVQQECTTLSTGIENRFIQSQGRPLVKSPIEVDFSGSAVDVNVDNISGTHSFLGQLTVSLESPSGEIVGLWDRECNNQTDFNVGFDDQAGQDINCPINTGRTYLPKDSLGVLNGQDVQGVWNLRVKDNVSGDGGKLEQWSFELCFESNPIPPNFYLLDTLRIEFDGERSVYEALRLSHPTFNPWDITIQPINLPAHGELVKIENGEETTLELGDNFTMQDLFSDRVYVRHSGGSEVNDSVRFYAISPDQGWTNAQTLPIKYQTQVSSENVSKLTNHSIKAWPSPTDNILNVQLQGKSLSGNWTLYNIYGEKILNKKVRNSSLMKSLNVSNYSSGIYFIRWQSDEGMLSQKVIIK